MLLCTATVAEARQPATTADAGKIRLGGGYRLPETTADTASPGGDRRSGATADAGKIRLGGGYRLPVQGA